MSDAKVEAQPTPFGLDVRTVQLGEDVQGQVITFHTVVGPISLFCDNSGVRQIISSLQEALEKSEGRVLRPQSGLILPGQQ